MKETNRTIKVSEHIRLDAKPASRFSRRSPAYQLKWITKEKRLEREQTFMKNKYGQHLYKRAKYIVCNAERRINQKGSGQE